MHNVYLNLGSNIEPEKNIPQAIQLLRQVTNVVSVSSIWETESVGYDAANFLNVCVLIHSELSANELKEKFFRPIEMQLGRVRNGIKNAPRTIDIDIVLFDETPDNLSTWNYAFVFVPLAELLPDFQHPTFQQKLSALTQQNQVWILKREDVNL
jgi:2-amino-4-hydroxy-6-hydroxymethyldihydropteridine diphosphokinase